MQARVYRTEGLATETLWPPHEGQACTVTTEAQTRLTAYSVTGRTICWHPSQRTSLVSLFSSLTGECLEESVDQSRMVVKASAASAAIR
jgi:hypothetical protein